MVIRGESHVELFLFSEIALTTPSVTSIDAFFGNISADLKYLFAGILSPEDFIVFFQELGFRVEQCLTLLP